MNETDGPELGVLILLSLASQEPTVECCLLGVGGYARGKAGLLPPALSPAFQHAPTCTCARVPSPSASAAGFPLQ